MPLSENFGMMLKNLRMSPFPLTCGGQSLCKAVFLHFSHKREPSSKKEHFEEVLLQLGISGRCFVPYSSCGFWLQPLLSKGQQSSQMVL